MSASGSPLGGGRSTRVIRVGETVRRTVGPWTPTVHAYLRHLRSRGFTGAPEVLGIDEEGREILSFIAGETFGDTVDAALPIPELPESVRWPEPIRSDAALDAAARLLRRLHDAAEGFRPERPIWREYEWPMRPGEIVCHGDVAPWNTVYRDGVPVAFIDWDSAHPDLAVMELAGACWDFVPLGPDDSLRAFGFVDGRDQGRRLRFLCDAYAVRDRGVLLYALKEVRIRNLYRPRYWDLRAGVAARLLRIIAEELEWFEQHQAELAANLEVGPLPGSGGALR